MIRWNTIFWEKDWYIYIIYHLSILGVGIATMCLVFYLDIYYCVIIAWTFFYFIAAFTAIPDLPWNTCGKNRLYHKYVLRHILLIIIYSFRKWTIIHYLILLDGWWNKETCFMVTDNSTADHISIANHTQKEFHKHNKTTTPVEEFWE